MKRILRRLPSPAMVVACIALAVALGGTSYAAIKLPRNSVGTKQLRKDAVTAIKLSQRSVGPRKLQNNAVTTRTVKKDQLTGEKIVEATLQKVPSATMADTAANSNTVGGYLPRRFSTSVAPNGPAATVLSLNGLVISLACPSGSVQLLANNGAGEAAQLRFDGVDDAAAVFEGGSADFVGTTNANLNNSVSSGSGAAYYVRANGTGVTALYGWRNDALGGTSACRVFGQAVGG